MRLFTLFLVCLCFWVNLFAEEKFDTFAASKPGSSGRGKSTPLGINPEENPGFQPGVIRRVNYDPKGKRNPFIPLITPDGRVLKLDTSEERIEDISLEGIMYDKAGIFFAIVNGLVVRTGDSIGGYQVLKIEKDKIVLIKDTQVREVSLNKGGI